MTRLAVITCCHGHAEYLPESLASIAAQHRLPDLHVVVSDGDPAAAEIFDRYCAEVGYQAVHVRHAMRQGAAAAWNAGLEVAVPRADFVLKHDADDIAEATYLNSLATSIQKDPNVDIVFTPLVITSSGERCGYKFPHSCIYRFPEYSRERMTRECCIPAQAAVRSDLFLLVSGADTTMPAGEDWDLFVRLGLLTDLRVRQLSHAGWRYLDRGGPRTSDHVKREIGLYRNYFAGHTRESVLAGSRNWAGAKKETVTA
jgi:glycosyltransferase involved in cell wall biosynthesis